MSIEPLVLAVDDEAGILRLIRLELGAHGFRVVVAQSGEEAIRVAVEQRPDMALLDIVMPQMSGLEVMRRLRERSNMPVILLTARGSEIDKVRGLELGADDYMAKPFSPDELAARVRAVLRRAPRGSQAENVVRAHGVEVDFNRRLVKKHGELIALTRTEWMLLQHLAANAGKILLNAELLAKVWGPEYGDDLQYLRVWISRLRRKLEDNPSSPTLLRTFQGIGYMFVEGEAAASEENTPPTEPKETVTV